MTPLEPPPGTVVVCSRCGTSSPAEDRFCETCGLRLTARPSQIQGPAVVGPDLAIVTDIGKRHARNEDAGAIAGEVIGGVPAYALVVCDGVSTASSSDQLAAAASAAAQAALVAVLKAGRESDVATGVADAIRAAHAAGCALDLESEEGKDAPGATIVAAVAWPGRITVGWLGDSRAYWVNGSGARALTEDDSLSPTSHVITHCIGPLEDVDGQLEPHVRTTEPSTPGLLMLCSDGLWNYAADEVAMTALMGSVAAEADAETVARALVQFALDKGGIDNVTVAVARVSSLSSLSSNGVLK